MTKKRFFISLLIIVIMGMILPNIAMATFDREACMSIAKGITASQLQEAIKELETGKLEANILLTKEKAVYELVLADKLKASTDSNNNSNLTLPTIRR